jgi:hypothetical protein
MEIKIINLSIGNMLRRFNRWKRLSIIEKSKLGKQSNSIIE